VHSTVAYNSSNLQSVDSDLKAGLSQYRGKKLLMRQDDHYKPHLIAQIVKQKKFDGMLTIVRDTEWEMFYPESLVGKVRFLTVHTGYVSPQLQALDRNRTAIASRPVDIAYRGSTQPDNFGRLAFEKRDIGDRFLKLSAAASLNMDISSRWEDRFMGDSWFDFLRRSKSVLGVESGASIVDFEGHVETAVKKFAATQPGYDFEQLYENVLRPHEDKIYYKAISPRHLEAIATRTVQILYEGDYSGLFTPWRHSIPLKRDFSNVDEVLNLIRQPEKLEQIAQWAFDEILLRPGLQYEYFVRSVDDFIESL
jgi:hypothetical protein